jgi:hypothetical protein
MSPNDVEITQRLPKWSSAQGFCGTCGSPLYATTPGEGKQPMSMLRVGILRQRGEFTPKRQIWVRSAQPWTMGLDTVPKTEKGS